MSTEKSPLEAESQPSCLGAVISRAHNDCKYTTFFVESFELIFLFDKNVVYLLL